MIFVNFFKQIKLSSFQYLIRHLKEDLVFQFILFQNFKFIIFLFLGLIFYHDHHLEFKFKQDIFLQPLLDYLFLHQNQIRLYLIL